MDVVDTERVNRGLPNLQVRGATDLAIIRRLIIEKLGEKYPAWRRDFENTDRGVWRRRIERLQAIATDPRLNRPDRQDLVGLRQYLRLRGAFLAELAARNAKTLTARSNLDLALMWETATAQMVERNLAFGALYHRWLSNDPLTLETAVEAAA